MSTPSLPGEVHHDPVLTREVGRTLRERALRDPPFVAALEDETNALMRTSKHDDVRLAAELGLIGGFSSAEGDFAARHSVHLKSRLCAKRAAESVPPSVAVRSPPTHRKP